MASAKKMDFAGAKNSQKPVAANWPITVEDGSDTLLVGTKPQFTYPALSSEAQGGGFLNLTVYTDGVTDAQNTAGETFTKKQLLKIAENSSRTAQDLIRKIKTRIDEHILGADQFDDITIVALHRK
jgi:sigma-B regulation protein RsbU (phosphoserine phosphatase)